MSLLLSCLILGGLFYPVTIFAKTTVENSEGLLKRLDRTIEEKTSLRLRYLNNLQQLKSKAVEQKGEKLIETYQQLFRAYAHFQSDSALAYLDLIEENVKDSKRAFELLLLYSFIIIKWRVLSTDGWPIMVRSEKIAKFSNS